MNDLPRPCLIFPLTMATLPARILDRRHEIVAEYYRAIDAHLDDILAGRATKMYEIRDVADLLCIHPTHLSNTLRLVTGHSPCFYFEDRLMQIARRQLAETNRPIADIALALTFDPSNFTKFFKRFEGCTPRQYRDRLRMANAELVTI